MAWIRGIPAQLNPTAALLTDLYTVPTGQEFTGRIIITNRGPATTFRVALSPDGVAIANEHYVAYDKPIAANDTGSTIAFMVNENDVIRVFANLATLSFTLTGVLEDESP